MDYVLYDDIDDSEYGVSKDLRELNRIFYGDCHEVVLDSHNDNKKVKKKGKK